MKKYKKCYCKTDNIINEKGLHLKFKINECYNYIEERVFIDDSIFVYYNKKESPDYGIGYRFFYNSKYKPLQFNDYFCTFKEFRKLKMKKLNEYNKD